MPKNKDIEVNEKITFSQVSWFLLFPNICIYGFGYNKGFSKISTIKIYGIHSKIKTMLWNVGKEQVFYRLESNKLFVATADELQLYKEETMEEIKVDIPKGYEFAGVDDTTQQVMFTKIQPEYPKTFDECSVVLSELPHTTLISSFYKLLVCRDAYWQIADWKYDVNKTEEYFYIVNRCGRIVKEHYMNFNHILAFPTAEMRDAFYGNFRKLIEECKEFL